MKEMIEPELLKMLETSIQTGKWKVYEEYKDSGVEWLGEIPVHWESTVLKRYVKSLKDGTHGTFQRVQEGIPLLSAKNVDNGKVQVSDHESLISEVDYHSINGNGYLKIGDLLLTIVGTIGRTAIFEYPFSVAFQRSVAVLRFQNKHYARYFFYLMQSSYVQAELSSRAKQSAQSGIYLSDVALVPGLAPPLTEQYTITAFLDYKMTQLNELIARKERMITLLQERRTAVINQAVIKGLNPDGAMKDSGVDWLEKLPAHWDIVKLKRVSKIRYGLGQPPKELVDGTPLIRATNIKSGRVAKEGMMYVDPDDVPISKNATLSSNEIIVVRSGAYTGDSAIIPPEYNNSIIGYDLALTILNAHSPFIAWQILSGHVSGLQFNFHRQRAAQPHLNAEEVFNTTLTLPPIEEQKEIASYLDQETAKIDKLITVIQEGIKKLKEYSTALISAAVTGKIDVRGEVTNVQIEETAM